MRIRIELNLPWWRRPIWLRCSRREPAALCPWCHYPTDLAMARAARLVACTGRFDMAMRGDKPRMMCLRTPGYRSE